MLNFKLSPLTVFIGENVNDFCQEIKETVENLATTRQDYPFFSKEYDNLVEEFLKTNHKLIAKLERFAIYGSIFYFEFPENSLHPRKQVELLEKLAIAVNCGMRIVIVTHSPYIMSHLNNLLLGGRHSLDAYSEYLFLQDKQAVLTLDQVSAYEVKEGQLIDLKDKNSYAINFQSIHQVSKYLDTLRTRFIYKD